MGLGRICRRIAGIPDRMAARENFHPAAESLGGSNEENHMRKKTIEEYVELIYILEQEHGHAHTGTIAAEMDIKAPSVTEMLQKLDKEGLVEYQGYTGATLTEKGKKMALALMEKHRVIQEFLELIGIDATTAERDACQIEHHVSTGSVRRLEKFVEFLQHDPDLLDKFRADRERE
jgi:Mn-dependent DtxR family transcriptional regulator